MDSERMLMTMFRRIFSLLFKAKTSERIQKQSLSGNLPLSGGLNVIAKTKEGRTKAVRDNTNERQYSADYNDTNILEKIIPVNKNGFVGKRGKEKEIETGRRFLATYNRTQGTNFTIAAEQPAIDSEVDVVLEDPSSGCKLHIQIRVSDEAPWRPLAQNGFYERSGDAFEICRNSIKKAINDKVTKYPEGLRTGLLLILDGWPGVRQEDLRRFTNLESDFLEKAKYKEIWFIGITDDTIHKLFP